MLVECRGFPIRIIRSVRRKTLFTIRTHTKFHSCSRCQGSKISFTWKLTGVGSIASLMASYACMNVCKICSCNRGKRDFYPSCARSVQGGRVSIFYRYRGPTSFFLMPDKHDPRHDPPPAAPPDRATQSNKNDKRKIAVENFGDSRSV